MRQIMRLIAIFLLLFAAACGDDRGLTGPSKTALVQATTPPAEPPSPAQPPSDPPSQPPTQPGPIPPPLGEVVFVGAGDIAVCGSQGAVLTARLLDSIAGTVFTLGDNVYPNGSMENYRACYEPTWGRHLARTRAAPGNHDWSEGDSGVSYFNYFGFAAGPPGLGYYSFDYGAWHIISLNSEISMRLDSAQDVWLRADLAANRSKCALAYWHYPLFTSGQNPAKVRDAWRALYDAGADVILNGHEHAYERFRPQDPDGQWNEQRGIRQFTAGTGGAPLYRRRTTAENSELYDSTSWGVLKLTLKAASYNWEFIPVAGASFRDSGTGACH